MCISFICSSDFLVVCLGFSYVKNISLKNGLLFMVWQLRPVCFINCLAFTSGLVNDNLGMLPTILVYIILLRSSFLSVCELEKYLLCMCYLFSHFLDWTIWFLCNWSYICDTWIISAVICLLSSFYPIFLNV